jgi:hypothetical protein
MTQYLNLRQEQPTKVEVGDFVFLKLSTNSVKTIQEVSLVKNALEMADNKQTLQIKSFAVSSMIAICLST